MLLPFTSILHVPGILTNKSGRESGEGGGRVFSEGREGKNTLRGIFIYCAQNILVLHESNITHNRVFHCA